LWIKLESIWKFEGPNLHHNWRMPFKVTTRLSIRYKLLPVVEVATEVSDLDVPELSGHKNLTFSHHKFQNICRPNGFVCKNLR